MKLLHSPILVKTSTMLQLTAYGLEVDVKDRTVFRLKRCLCNEWPKLPTTTAPQVRKA